MSASFCPLLCQLRLHFHLHVKLISQKLQTPVDADALTGSYCMPQNLKCNIPLPPHETPELDTHKSIDWSSHKALLLFLARGESVDCAASGDISVRFLSGICIF